MKVEPSDVIDLTRELVRRESLSGKEQKAVAVAEQAMRSLGFDRVWVDECGSAVGVIHGAEEGPTVVLDSHVDVMPATSLDDWRFDPFGADLHEGRIYGRGATDTKGGLAAAICAAAGLDRSRIRGSVAVSASIGEELIEGVALARVIEDTKPSLCIVVEPTSLELAFAQKGQSNVWVRVTGRPAHTSRPELGDNAIYKMVALIDKLRNFPPKVHPVVGPRIVELIEITSEPFPGQAIVPDGCQVRCDCRVVPGETAESLLAEFRDLVGDQATVGFRNTELTCYTGKEFQVLDFHAGWVLDPNGPIVQGLVRALQGMGQEGKLFAAPYATNASYSAGVANIPTVIYGPGSVEQAHIVDEFVSASEVVESMNGLRSMIEAALAGGLSL